MLRLYLGRAGSGKTSYILRELAEKAEKRQGENVLIIPEQYSHDCERALAALGDTVCLYSEVLSFTRLASRVFAETGGIAAPTLDAGGRILAMSLAWMSVAPQLKVYDVGGRRPDFIKSLLAAYDELRCAGAHTDALSDAAGRAEGTLAGKLEDLALIFERFDAVKEQCGADARDTVERLADQIGESSVGAGGVWIDGFTDFTRQELRVIEELLRRGTDVTVCLGTDDLLNRELTFRLPVKTAHRLLELAGEHNTPTELKYFAKSKDRDAALSYMESALLDYSAPPWEGESGSVEIYAAGSVSEECAVAAAKTLELVRGGARFRDIAVVSPSFSEYAPILEGVFAKYGVPVTSTEKSDILEKPAMAFITGALDIITGGWDYQSVFRYLKTGLSGLSLKQLDALENYVLKWNLRGAGAWSREWTMPPGGYTDTVSEEDKAALKALNALRERVAAPLIRLSEAMKGADMTIGKARAVYSFMEETELYGKLYIKSEELKTQGRAELAQEYRQLWSALTGALSQFSAIMWDTEISTEEFVRLYKLVLGQYKVGVIPSSVDSVRAGDMTRLRARGIKHLIVLGAVDGALPVSAAGSGVFSDAEREELRELGIDTLDDREDSLARELSGVYVSLTVPTESLTFTYPVASRRSYIVSRAEKLFGIAARTPGEEIWTAAAEPCFELAASGEGDAAKRAAAYFQGKPQWKPRLEAVREAARTGRGSLTPETAGKLYGKRLRLSASQIDRFYSCRYAYFLQYGLRVKPRGEAALDAPESGTFIHFVLERVARKVKEDPKGFHSPAVTEEYVRGLVDGAVREYVDGRLGGLENKGGRFKYLFKRLSAAAMEIALSMREELSRSDFVPLDFELRFAEDGDLPSVKTAAGDSVVGAVDRVDGWEKDGKLYLRVVDYKTGKKAMDLRDVFYGVGLQMLIYLFALQREGSGRYGGREIVPAGVLYSPARDAIVSSKTDLSDEELRDEREKLIKYSGLILADSEVIAAMDSGSGKRLPVTVSSRTGELTGSLASAEQLGKLGRTVDRLIGEMADEVRRGAINANPYLKGKLESACMFCKFHDACHFADGTGGEGFRRFSKLRDAEVWELIDKENGGQEEGGDE